MEAGWTGRIGWCRSAAVSERWVHAHTSSTKTHTHTQTITHTQKEITDKWPKNKLVTILSCLIDYLAEINQLKLRSNGVALRHKLSTGCDKLLDHFLTCVWLKDEVQDWKIINQMCPSVRMCCCFQRSQSRWVSRRRHSSAADIDTKIPVSLEHRCV